MSNSSVKKALSNTHSFDLHHDSCLGRRWQEQSWHRRGTPRTQKVTHLCTKPNTPGKWTKETLTAERAEVEPINKQTNKQWQDSKTTVCTSLAWWLGTWLATRQTQVQIHFSSSFSLKAVVYEQCLLTLPPTHKQRKIQMVHTTVHVSAGFWWGH